MRWLATLCRATTFLLILYLSTGCGIISQLKQNNLFKYPTPYLDESCGPIAIHEIFDLYDIPNTTKDISGEIQVYRNLSLTSILYLGSLIDHETLEVTYPSEIQAMMERHGLQVYIFTGSDKECYTLATRLFREQKVCIIFSRCRDTFYMHYSTYPSARSNEKAINPYGKKTNRLAVYWIVHPIKEPRVGRLILIKIGHTIYQYYNHWIEQTKYWWNHLIK